MAPSWAVDLRLLSVTGLPESDPLIECKVRDLWIVIVRTINAASAGNPCLHFSTTHLPNNKQHTHYHFLRCSTISFTISAT